ncbi:yolk ferritin-like [Pecten maximus]|uniref:yolk ferritin-like n=1 Tax=Pecten maximus TaxID=6579 RepID=UPI001458695C|nr:yolk ferritin-like [Pecten maximus]
MKTFVIFVSLVACCLADWNHVDSVKDKFSNAHIELVIKQINTEQSASYFYQAYSKFFKRGDVALDGFSKWFATAAKEENDHAEKFMDYLNMRGAQLNLEPVNLQEVCDIVSEQIRKFSQFNRNESCICNFMSNRDHTHENCPRSPRKWFTGLQAMEDSLVLERYVNDKLLDLHKETLSDPNLSHLLEHEFLGEQVDSIKQYADFITKLRRVGSGLGEYEFDRTLQ